VRAVVCPARDGSVLLKNESHANLQLE
jgi:hypothetical protein